MPRYTHKQRVLFVDTDMAGIVHFSNFYRWMEAAELGFWRSMGLNVVALQPDGSSIGWPRVRADCHFEAPAFFDDEIEIDIDILRIGEKSLTLSFVFRRGTTQIAAGELTSVCCRRRAPEGWKSIVIPPAYRRPLEGASA
ncbi:MAG: acyl-CoA thioesterase [Planctomycetaceae bacterium]